MNPARTAFWLTIGRTTRMGMAFLAPIVLTRALIREDYGAFKQIDLAAGLLAPMLLVGLDRSLTYYIPRPGRDPRVECSTVIWSLVAICFAFCSVMAALPWIPQWIFSLGGLYVLTLAVLAGAAEGAMTLATQKALVAAGHGRTAGMAPVLLGFPYFVALIVVAILTGSLAAVATVAAAGAALTAIACLVILRRHGMLGFCFDPRALRRHVGFAGPLWIIGLVETWGGRMDRFLVSTAMGVGNYALFAVGTAGLPFVRILPGAVRDASAPMFSRYESEGRLDQIARLWKRGSEVVLPIYLLAAIGQIYMAHLLVPLMYTEAFRGATPVFMVAAATTFLGIFGGMELVLRALLEFRFLAALTGCGLALRIGAGIAVLPFHSLPLQAAVQACIAYGDVAARLLYARRRLGVGWGGLLPTKGWLMALGLAGACAAASALMEVMVAAWPLLPKTLLLLAPWGIAAAFVLNRLRLELRRSAEARQG